MFTEEAFILGSGFSKELFEDMPLLNELTESVLKEIEREGDRSLFKKIYDKYIKNKNIGNFEDILTYLYQNFPWKSEEEYHLLYSLYIHISEILVNVFKKVQNKINYNFLFKRKHITNFLKYLHISKANVITFNYDTLLEETSTHLLKPLFYVESRPTRNFNYLEEASYNIDVRKEYTSHDKKVKIIQDSDRKIKIYFYNYEITEEEFVSELNNIEDSNIKNDLRTSYRTFKSFLKDRFIHHLDIYPISLQRLASRTTTLFGHHYQATYRLFKLHGSINWYYSGYKDIPAYQIFLVGSSNVISEEEKNIKDLMPVIIPPVLDKTYFFKQSTIRAQWSEVKHILNRAKKIYIIGYSMPQTDLTVKFMLQSFIKKNAEVIVVNKDEDKKRYFQKIFNNFNDRYIRKDDPFKQFVEEEIPVFNY